MLRFPRLSLVITVVTVLYATILTLLVSNSPTHNTWLSRISPSPGDGVPFAQHDHDQHTLNHLEPVTATVTRTTTAIATTTVTAVQTVAPPIPGPAYCDECGEGDVLCKEYG